MLVSSLNFFVFDFSLKALLCAQTNEILPLHLQLNMVIEQCKMNDYVIFTQTMKASLKEICNIDLSVMCLSIIGCKNLNLIHLQKVRNMVA